MSQDSLIHVNQGAAIIVTKGSISVACIPRNYNPRRRYELPNKTSKVVNWQKRPLRSICWAFSVILDKNNATVHKMKSQDVHSWTDLAIFRWELGMWVHLHRLTLRPEKSVIHWQQQNNMWVVQINEQYSGWTSSSVTPEVLQLLPQQSTTELGSFRIAHM